MFPLNAKNVGRLTRGLRIIATGSTLLLQARTLRSRDLTIEGVSIEDVARSCDIYCPRPPLL